MKSTLALDAGCENSSKMGSFLTGLSTTAQFKKCEPKNYCGKDSCNVTSLLALEDGRSPSESPASETTNRSGLAPAHASHSATLAQRWASVIRAIYSRRSAALSLAASQQSSLESRLRATLDVNGSPEYALKWRHWDMPHGPRVCALLAYARPTYVNAYSGVLPTVTARDYRWGMAQSTVLKRAKSSKRGVNLNEFMQRALGRPGRLNPRFTLLLMGYPETWHSSGARAMQSIRGSRRNLSKQP